MRFFHRTSLTLAAVMAAALLTLPAHASPRGMNDWMGGELTTSKVDQLWGWSFEVSTAINVTSLGLYDLHADGLNKAHRVGIFRSSDSSLLASVLVGSGNAGTLDSGNFRYTALDESVSLVSGEIYTIVMQEFGSLYGIDPQYVNATQVFTADEVHYLGSDMAMGSGLEMPDGGFTHVADGSYIGPNFQFSTDTNAVPEPGTSTLVLAALVALGWVARRRRSA